MLEVLEKRREVRQKDFGFQAVEAWDWSFGVMIFNSRTDMSLLTMERIILLDCIVYPDRFTNHDALSLMFIMFVENFINKIKILGRLRVLKPG